MVPCRAAQNRRPAHCRISDTQDKNADNRATAEAKFKDISEAYEVRARANCCCGRPRACNPVPCLGHWRKTVSSACLLSASRNGHRFHLPAQVLSDAQKRRIYDQFGEEGLKGGIPTNGHAGGSAGGMPAGMHFSGMPGGAGMRFQPRSADDVFAEVRTHTATVSLHWQATFCWRSVPLPMLFIAPARSIGVAHVLPLHAPSAACCCR